MRPTPVRLLLAVAVAAGAVTYAVVRLWYGSLPLIPLYAPGTVAFLAVAELFTATSVRARLHGAPGTRPIDPLVVARLVALAKASAYAGSIALGGYVGYLAYAVQGLDNPNHAHDAGASAFGAAMSLVLVLAALLLERVCRVPGPPEDDEPPEEPEWDPLADWHRDDGRR
ncbi:MAG: DUF3180 domain-containing protein [Frankiaceae bacterium]